LRLYSITSSAGEEQSALSESLSRSGSQTEPASVGKRWRVYADHSEIIYRVPGFL
jgi:hypothetical protein